MEAAEARQSLHLSKCNIFGNRMGRYNNALTNIIFVISLTLYVLIDSSFWFDTLDLEWSHVLRGHKIYVFLSLKIILSWQRV